MTLIDINLISFKDIQNLTVPTSQKISNKNLTKFLQSSLQLYDISLLENDKLFFTFVEESNIYEIYILNSNITDITLEDYIYESHTFNSKYKYELFVFKTHFIIYKDNQYYFSKINNNYEINDIINFVEFKYKIKIKSIKIINEDTYVKYKSDYIKSNKLNKINFINLNSTNSFIYYILYLILLFVFIYFNSQDTLGKEVKVNTTNKVLPLKNENINILIHNLNKHKILVSNISFENKNYSLSLSSKNINNIHRFLNIYKHNLKIINVNFNNKIYYLKVKIEI